MNTGRLFELKNDLIRYQASGVKLEECLQGFDAAQSKKYSSSIKNQLFQIEEAYCNAMEEIRAIKAFLYAA